MRYAWLLVFIVITAAAVLTPALSGDGEPRREGCYAIDGDTLDCGGERIRLLALDAPELSAPGGEESRNALAFVADGEPRIHRQGKDRYGRTVALVKVNGLNLTCSQIEAGQGRYWPRYDPAGIIRQECGL